jgi:aminoglycoside phosphotransferase (APT) family kinase protein
MVGGKPLFLCLLFPGDYGVPHGPLTSDEELWEEMTKSWKGVPEKARRRLRERMPCAAPFTFTHGDLTDSNIIVENGNLTGIIDWEASGYFPVWWEFAFTGIGLGSEDREWKNLLQKHMPDYKAAMRFFINFWIISGYPDLDERGQKLLDELMRDKD